MAIWDKWLKKKEEKSVPLAPSGGLNWLSEVPAWNKAELIRQYAQHNWVYAVVSKIAQAVSAVNWRLYTEDSDGSQIEITEGPIYELLKRPNKFTSWQELIELTQIYLELAGEAFWVLTLNGRGEPTEIWTVSPDRMSIVNDPDDFIKGYVYRVGMEQIPLEVEEVIHFKYPNPADPYRGMGPVKAAMLLIQNDRYTQEYANAFFYNSAMPSGIIRLDKQLTVKQFLELKERWNAQHRGINKAHKIAVLDNGAEFVPLSYSIRDLQLVDVRKQNRDDILATFGVHASILGISENVNRANAEAAEYTFAKRIVEPRLQKIAGKINAELLPKWKTAYKMTFEFMHEIPEDTDTLLRKIQTGVQLGLMTVNEARNLLGLEDIKGGDIVLQPMSLMPTPVEYASDSIDEDEGINIPDEEEEATNDKNWGQKSASSLNRNIYRAIIWKRFIRKQKQHEKAFKKALKPAWDFFKQEVEKAIKQGGGLEAVDMEAVIQKMHETAKVAHAKVVEDFAKQGYSDAKALLHAVNKAESIDYEDIDDYIDMNLPHIVEWLETYTFKFAQEVSKTTIEMLRRELQQALENGEGIDSIMERVANIFHISSDGWRAERIARTETIRSANFGSMEGYRQAGIRKKEWITALDERTREAHARADGQVVGIDDTFIVGGEPLRFPGDPTGSPENTINCRCTVAPVVE